MAGRPGFEYSVALVTKDAMKAVHVKAVQFRSWLAYVSLPYRRVLMMQAYKLPSWLELPAFVS